MKTRYISPGLLLLGGRTSQAAVSLLIGLVILTPGLTSPGMAQDGDTKPKEESKSPKEPSKAKDTADAKKKSKPPKATLAVRGATIHTMGSQGLIEDGVVLIAGQKILAVGGPSLEIPKSAKVINVAGMTVTPGLIDASSQLWLTASAANATASNASLNVLDGIDTFDDQWHEVIRQGVTSVYVQPGRRGTLGGYGAVLSVAPADDGPEVLLDHAALQASLGVGATSNQARSQQFEGMKKVLKSGQDYQEKWDEYNEYLKKQAAAKKKAEEDKKKPSKSGSDTKKASTDGKPSADKDGKKDSKETAEPTPGRRVRSRVMGRAPPTSTAKATEEKEASKAKSTDEKKSQEKEKPPEKPEHDAAKERLAKVVAGEIPLRLEINTSDDAYFAKKLFGEFSDLQIVLSGLGDLRSAADEIVQLNAPVVVGPWLDAESSYRSEPDSRSEWAKRFAGYKGSLVVGTAGTVSRSSRLLRSHASRSVAAGIDATTALKSITINAARTLGVADKVGSIEAGKRADLVCFTGHPLDTSTSVGLVVAAGKVAVNRLDSDFASASAPSTVSSFEFPTGKSQLAIKTSNYLLEDGTTQPRLILIDQDSGTIKRVSPADSDVDSGVEVVDVGNAWVTPGLFSAHATLGLSRFVDTRLSDSTYVVAADAATSGFEGEQELVDSGMLRALLSPGNGNTLAGSSSLLCLGSDDQIGERFAAMKINLTQSARSADRFPSSLPGQTQLIKESLAGKLLDTRLYVPEAVQKRLSRQRSERLDSLTSGQTLALLSVSSDAEVRAALDLVERLKIKAALVGSTQLAPFAKRIKSLGVSVVARPTTPSDFDWYAGDIQSAANLGIKVLFAGETAEQLRLTASLAVESGMPASKALQGLCFGPQLLLGTKLEAADFVVWSESPLNLAAKPLSVFVDGKIAKSQAQERESHDN